MGTCSQFRYVNSGNLVCIVVFLNVPLEVYFSAFYIILISTQDTSVEGKRDNLG